ncbi:MAG: hypothetical protein LBL38_02055 [Lactobacillales bacterium]|jgi:hypothetical protein|nr:hypothetical protein [Lactobacillales bacterium]
MNKKLKKVIFSALLVLPLTIAISAKAQQIQDPLPQDSTDLPFLTPYQRCASLRL